MREIRNENIVRLWNQSSIDFANSCLVLDMSSRRERFRRIISCNCETAVEMLLKAGIFAYGDRPFSENSHSLFGLLKQLSTHHKFEDTEFDRMKKMALDLGRFAGSGRFPDSLVNDLSENLEIDDLNGIIREPTWKECLDYRVSGMSHIDEIIHNKMFIDDFGICLPSSGPCLTEKGKAGNRYPPYSVSSVIGKESVSEWCECSTSYADAVAELCSVRDRKLVARSICCFCELAVETGLKAALISQGDSDFSGHSLSGLVKRIKKKYRFDNNFQTSVDILDKYSGEKKYPDKTSEIDVSETESAIRALDNLYPYIRSFIEYPERHLISPEDITPSETDNRIVIPVRTPKKKIRLRMKPLPPKPEENEDEDGGALSSETARILYGQQASERAQRMYEDFRKDDSDIALICASTGLSEDVISRVKNHLFIQEHDFPDGKHRFKPYYAVADSWKNLMSGTVRRHDILLLQHELLEISLMDEGMSQRAAHETAGRYFDFEGQSRRYYEFIRSKDEAVPKKTVAKRKDTGRSSR